MKIKSVMPIIKSYLPPIVVGVGLALVVVQFLTGPDVDGYYRQLALHEDCIRNSSDTSTCPKSPIPEEYGLTEEDLK